MPITDPVYKRLVFEQTVLHLSDLIRFQDEAAMRVLKENQNGYFPDDNPRWKAKDGDESWADHAEYVRSCNEDNELANHRFNLSLVHIDRSMVAVKIVDKPEEGLGEYLTKEMAWKHDDTPPIFYLLGEIAGQAGHVTVVRQDGKVFPCIHDWNFYVAPPGEI